MDSDIGSRLRAWRKSKALSQAEVARSVGCSQPHISTLEQGGQEPTLELLRKFAGLFGCTVAHLLEGPLPGEQTAAPAERPLLTVDVREDAPSIVPEGTQLRAVGGEGV